MGRIFEHGGVMAREHDVTCPECHSRMVLRSTEKFRWKNGTARLFYGCSRWPHCRGIHGAHPDGAPLGVPATGETKAARQRAHAQFDALRAEKNWSKKEAYHWLGQKLGMKDGLQIKEECHIAMFDLETCNRVVVFCANKRKSVPPPPLPDIKLPIAMAAKAAADAQFETLCPEDVDERLNDVEGSE